MTVYITASIKFQLLHKTFGKSFTTNITFDEKHHYLRFNLNIFLLGIFHHLGNTKLKKIWSFRIHLGNLSNFVTNTMLVPVICFQVHSLNWTTLLFQTNSTNTTSAYVKICSSSFKSNLFSNSSTSIQTNHTSSTYKMSSGKFERVKDFL